MRIVEAIKTGVATVLLVWFLLGAFLLVTVPWELHAMTEVRTWPSREGIITNVYVTQVTGASRRNPASVKPEIKGLYQDTGEVFWIDRVRYGDFGWGDGRKQAEAAVAKYPVGTKVQVYYSPTDPADNVLEPFAPWDTMLTLLGIGAVGVLNLFALYLFGVLRRRVGMRTTQQ